MTLEIKLYIVKSGVAYEGEDILSIFDSVEEAREYMRLYAKKEGFIKLESKIDTYSSQRFGDNEWLCIDEIVLFSVKLEKKLREEWNRGYNCAAGLLEEDYKGGSDA